MKYDFPKNLYTDVRIEETANAGYGVRNGEVEQNSAIRVTGAMIRVYDGELWYTSTTNDIDSIQQEIDNLATLAKPKPDILKDPVVARFEVHKAKELRYEGDKDIRRVTREEREALVNEYITACVDDSIDEIKMNMTFLSTEYKRKCFYSSKGAEIEQDYQACNFSMFYQIVVNGIATGAGKYYRTMSFDEVRGHEQEILAERDRYLDYARNAVDVEPGEYTCVLAPIVTAMFTHESFGHKSEADFMLNDKTLREEWVMGKKVGSEKVSICDSGALPNNGWVPYDDEGTQARETWLIKDGILTGRLHDAKSADALSEELTGNCRAQSYLHGPIVRMTNTYMAAGTDDPEEMLREIEDGIYVYNVNYGTGQSTFTMQPNLCYRIRNGKLCEPIRANVVTGSVFEALFDIDAVGKDFVLFDTYSCGKGGQSVPVSAGGPTVRVKKLTVN